MIVFVSFFSLFRTLSFFSHPFTLPRLHYSFLLLFCSSFNFLSHPSPPSLFPFPLPPPQSFSSFPPSPFLPAFFLAPTVRLWCALVLRTRCLLSSSPSSSSFLAGKRFILICFSFCSLLSSFALPSWPLPLYLSYAIFPVLSSLLILSPISFSSFSFILDLFPYS